MSKTPIVIEPQAHRTIVDAEDLLFNRISSKASEFNSATAMLYLHGLQEYAEKHAREVKAAEGLPMKVYKIACTLREKFEEGELEIGKGYWVSNVAREFHWRPKTLRETLEQKAKELDIFVIGHQSWDDYRFFRPAPRDTKGVRLPSMSQPKANLFETGLNLENIKELGVTRNLFWRDLGNYPEVVQEYEREITKEVREKGFSVIRCDNGEVTNALSDNQAEKIFIKFADKHNLSRVDCRSMDSMGIIYHPKKVRERAERYLYA